MKALLDWLVEHVMEFWPISIVYQWQTGLLVRNGRVRRTLAGGDWYIRIPLIEEVVLFTRTEQPLNLAAPSIMTKDGQCVTISANIGYAITDPDIMVDSVYDIEESIGNLAIGKLAQLCAHKEWDDLRINRAKIDKWLTRQLSKESKQWGVQIKRVYLTDCVPTKPLKHYIDGNGGVITDDE